VQSLGLVPSPKEECVLTPHRPPDAVADDAPPDLLDMTKIAPRVGGGRAVREHAEQANSRDRRRASYDDDEDDDMDEDDDE